MKTPPEFERRIPQGDNRERRVCVRCDHIDYENPRIVVGSVVRCEHRILLCRRAIEPRKGFWTLPAGFLEIGESPAEGAAREALEEANARIQITAVLAIYTVRHLSQVQIMHRAILAAPEFSPGPESLDVALFDWADIPWDDIAFPSVVWALNHDRDADDRRQLGTIYVNPQGEDGSLLGFTGGL